MMGLSNEDWETVNAYHDGELSPNASAVFERRLEREPSLVAELARIGQLRATLRELGDNLKQLPAEPASRPAGRRRKWVTGGALAAGLAMATYIGSGIPPGPAEIHAAFSTETYRVPRQISGMQPVVSPATPDLRLIDLVLVGQKTLPQGTAAHYLGQNGCRLTLFAGEGPFDPPSDQDIQTAAWRSKGQSFLLLANGMDQRRFTAVAGYLRVGEGRQTIAARSAVREAVSSTGSCA